MKTIGLIGGMSSESSKLYYELINETVKQKLGGLHSAKSIMYSFNFEEIKQLQYTGQWEEAGEHLKEAAQRLEAAGADLIVLCTNTMHKVAESIETAIQVPFLHIADATAEQISKAGIKKVGLLATRFTMEEDFYKGRLQEKYGLEVLVPDEAARQIVHDIIYNELCRGEINQNSREQYKGIISNLVRDGAEAIILGCTEITLLVTQADSCVPIFDTTAIHAFAAVDFALNKKKP